MAQVIEFEGAPEAINAGDKVAVSTSSTEVATAGQRKALILANPSTTATIWVTLAATGAVVGEGIALWPETGLVLKEYHGGVCAISSSGSVNVGRTEF